MNAVRIAGKRVCVAGAMKEVNLSQVKDALKAAGATVVPQVQKDVVLIVGGGPHGAGSKSQKVEAAQALGTEIVDWDLVDLTPVGDPSPHTAACMKSQVRMSGSSKLREKLEESLRATPTWSNDGETLRIWRENGRTIELAVEPTPGPYTPMEHVPEVVGQPDLLFEIARSIEKGLHFLLSGPSGTAKSTVCEWIARELNWNLVRMPCSRGLEEENMIGTNRPGQEKGVFPWVYGPVAKAVIASQSHPTLLVFEEMNRVSNQQVFAGIYELLDRTRRLTIAEKMDANGEAEVLRPGTLVVGATMNPADDEGGTYIGVVELDDALSSRFGTRPPVTYPPEAIEAQALVDRVPGLQLRDALQMVAAATRIRTSPQDRFPISFRELMAWGEALAYYPWEEAAESTVVMKAHADYRTSIRDLLKLRPVVEEVSDPMGGAA